MALVKGTRLGPYEITAPLGSGGMGVVYAAHDTRLNRDVAIKTFPEFQTADAERVRRFEVEAQSTGSLNHPNILTIFDVGAYQDVPYLVSERLEGQTLKDRLKQGKLSLSVVADYGRQIASGLAAAHAKGITHRDIKPDNLFVTKDGIVKILDFGIAKVNNAAANGEETIAATQPGFVMGTAGYMAPEQARGLQTDGRADIFSFGCVLFEALTGSAPFQGETAIDIVSAVVNREPEMDGIAHPAMRRIVAHCLEKSPERRFQSAADIAFQFAGIQETPAEPLPVTARASKRGWMPWTIAIAGLLGCAALAYLLLRPHPALAFRRMTFRRGEISAARFTPDGGGVVYSAKWESEPDDVFTERFDTRGARSLGFQGSALRSISAAGELAIAQDTRTLANPFAKAGLLARAPFSGGAPRPIENDIDFAEWAPNGTDLMVVRETKVGTQLEYPDGKVIFQTAGYISEPRISPDATKVAFIDHPSSFDNAGAVTVADKSGKKEVLTARYMAAQGLAWAPRGGEIWFTAALNGARCDLRAVAPNRKERILLSAPSSLLLQDVSKTGSVLLTSVEMRRKLMFRGSTDASERELSWLDWTSLLCLSPDGKYLSFFESGEGAGDSALAYIRQTSGAPPLLLGKGSNPTLSLDGKYAAVAGVDSSVTVYPTGAGQARQLTFPGFTIVIAGLMPDGKTLWFSGSQQGKGRQFFLASLDGGSPKAISPEGVQHTFGSVILDGKYLPGMFENKLRLFPAAGGPVELPRGVEAGERLCGWGLDNQTLFVAKRNEFPFKVYKVDRTTGKRTLLLTTTPIDNAGVGLSGLIQVTPDEKAYAYSISQTLSSLFVVDGVR